MTHPRRTVSPYLLSGIARCGRYGKALIAAEAKGGGLFYYYVGGTLIRQGAGSCDLVIISKKVRQISRLRARREAEMIIRNVFIPCHILGIGPVLFLRFFLLPLRNDRSVYIRHRYLRSLSSPVSDTNGFSPGEQGKTS